MKEARENKKGGCISMTTEQEQLGQRMKEFEAELEALMSGFEKNSKKLEEQLDHLLAELEAVSVLKKDKKENQKMSNYKERETERLIKLIESGDGNTFYGAKGGGLYNYKGKLVPEGHILEKGKEDLNLWEGIRKDAVSYFKDNDIQWWSGAITGNTCSSQISCINHLFPFRQDKAAVLQIISSISDNFVDVLKIETDKEPFGYIQFEGISCGQGNNLNEKGKRGKDITSIDALIYAIDKASKKWILPIEWKYTESPKSSDYSIEDGDGNPQGSEIKGKERLSRYSDLIKSSQALKAIEQIRGSIYFKGEFYQLMRQTLWAERMIAAKSTEKIKADDFICINVIPKGNTEMCEKRTAWTENLKEGGQDRFKIISPNDLLKNVTDAKYNELKKYLAVRYWA